MKYVSFKLQLWSFKKMWFSRFNWDGLRDAAVVFNSMYGRLGLESLILIMCLQTIFFWFLLASVCGFYWNRNTIALGLVAVIDENQADVPTLRIQALHHRKILQSQEQTGAANYCATGNFTALYDTIQSNLRIWRETGITARLMDRTLGEFYKYPVRHKGAGILFKGGKPFMITNSAVLNTTGHHQVYNRQQYCKILS